MACLLSLWIGPLGTNYVEIWNKIQFSCIKTNVKNVAFKMSPIFARLHCIKQRVVCIADSVITRSKCCFNQLAQLYTSVILMKRSGARGFTVVRLQCQCRWEGKLLACICNVRSALQVCLLWQIEIINRMIKNSNTDVITYPYPMLKSGYGWGFLSTVLIHVCDH